MEDVLLVQTRQALGDVVDDGLLAQLGQRDVQVGEEVSQGSATRPLHANESENKQKSILKYHCVWYMSWMFKCLDISGTISIKGTCMVWWTTVL